MKERPILVAVIGYIIGILWGLYFKISIVLCYLVMTAIHLIFKFFSKENQKNKFKLLSIKRYSRYLKIILDKKSILIILLFSIISNTVVIFQNGKYENSYQDNQNIEITGIIIGKKKEKQYYNLYQVKVIDSKHFNLYIQVNKKIQEFKYGDKVRIKGKFQKPSKQRNYKGYDDSKNLKTLKIAGRVKVDTIELIGKRKANIIMQYANDIRTKIEERIDKNFEKDKSEILKGLILGKTEDITEKKKENFQISNISHVLAISGMHINYIIVFLKMVFQKILGKRKTKFITILFLTLYVFLTGFSPSIIRAVVTGTILLGEIIVYRKSDFWNSIAISLLAILIYNPFFILNVGLQLSYLGVIGIVLLKPTISEILGNRFKFIKELFVVSLSVQIMIIPIILYHFNKIGIYFLVTNFLVSIIIGPIFILGVISILIPFIFSKITSLGLSLLDLVSKLSVLPFAKIYIPTPKIFMIILYFIVIFTVKNIYTIYKSETLNSTKRRIKNLIQLAKYKLKIEYKNRKYQKISIIILFIIIIFTIYPKSLKIHFVDVGQGDCTFIVTPHNKTILIDGGGSHNKEFDIGKSTLIPYLLDRGYTKIDYIMISHFDQDHVRSEF